MQTKWLKFMIISSLAFNIAFISLFIIQIFIFKPHQRPPEEEFKFANKPIIDKKFEKAHQIHLKFGTTKRLFFSKLVNKNTTDEELEEILDSLVTMQVARERIVGENLIKVRKEVGVEKLRKLFKNKARKNRRNRFHEQKIKPSN